MKVSEMLKSAKEILVNKGWTQGQLCVTAEGSRPFEMWDGTTTCFCGMGALCYVRGNEPPTARYEVYREALGLMDDLAFAAYHVSLVGFNDTEGRTKEEVWALFDKGIEQALHNESAEQLRSAP